MLAGSRLIGVDAAGLGQREPLMKLFSWYPAMFKLVGGGMWALVGSFAAVACSLVFGRRTNAPLIVIVFMRIAHSYLGCVQHVAGFEHAGTHNTFCRQTGVTTLALRRFWLSKLSYVVLLVVLVIYWFADGERRAGGSGSSSTS